MDPRIRELLLAYEELDAHERAEVDDWLSGRPIATRTLERLVALESIAASAGRDGPPFERFVSSAPSDADELESLRRLRAKLSPLRREHKGLRRGAIALLAAAAVSWFVFGPLRVDETPISELQLRARLRSSERGTASGSDTRVLHSGDAVEITFRLERRAFVSVLYVDPIGEAGLLRPADPSQEAALDAGEIQLPGEGAPSDWVLGAVTGSETFYVVVSGQPISQAMWQGFLDELPDGLERSQLLMQVEAALDAMVDHVERLDIEHRP